MFLAGGISIVVSCLVFFFVLELLVKLSGGQWFTCAKHCIPDIDMKISLFSLRRRAELSAAEASGSLGDHWFPDLPGAREDLPRERREGVP